MRALFWPTVCVAFLFTSTAFGAGRKPSDFNAAPEMTSEQLAAAKERSKSHLNGFDEKMEEKPQPMPWAFIGLAALAFSVASIFMVRNFRSTSKEIGAQDAYAGGRRPPRAED